MNSVEFSRTDLSRILVEISRIKILGSKNILGTFPHLIWGHLLCKYNHPHRRKDHLPLRLLRDIPSRSNREGAGICDGGAIVHTSYMNPYNR